MSHAVRPSAGDFLHQIGQYVRRPSHLFIAALLLPSYFPRFLLTFLLSILPVDWPRGERGKAFRLAVGNLVLLRHDRPAQAWHWMERVLRIGSRSTEEYFLGAVCLYQGLGRMREATALFARANECDVAQAEALGVARLPYRVLDETWARHIGDAAILDYVISSTFWRDGVRRTSSFTRRLVGASATDFSSRNWRSACAWSSGRTSCRSSPPPSRRCTITINFRGSRTAARSFSGNWPAVRTRLVQRRAGAAVRAAGGYDGAGLGAVGKSRRAARRLVRRAACARHPLARHDRRAASDPQCRHRELSAGDQRNNPSRRVRRSRGRCRRADFAAACERDRLRPERHGCRLDGCFPSGVRSFRPGVGVRADLRSAALWRALRADELVAAGDAALACITIFTSRSFPSVWRTEPI